MSDVAASTSVKSTMAIRINRIKFYWKNSFFILRNPQEYKNYRMKIFEWYGSSTSDFVYSGLMHHSKTFFFLEIAFLDIDYTYDSLRKFFR